MNVPMPVLAAVAIAFLLLLWLAFRRRGAGRDLMTPPTFPEHVHPPPAPAGRFSSAGGPLSLPAEAEAEIRALLRQRRKIDAIKRLRELSPMSLRDAKNMVERM